MFTKNILVTGFILFAVYRISSQCSPLNEIQSKIDIRHYKVNLQFDWDKKKAIAEVKISIAFVAPTQIVQLAVNELWIHSVYTSASKEIRYQVDTQNHCLEMALQKPYKSGDTLDIFIKYETKHHNDSDPHTIGGSFGKGIRFFQGTPTNPIKRKQLWSQSELFYTSYWLPCSHDISDLSTTEFIASVDSGFCFIANGNLVEKNKNKDGSVQFHYKTKTEYPIYLSAFAIGEYIDLIQNVNGIDLHTYCYPDEKEAAIASTVRLPDMLCFLENKTGCKYPFTHYGQVMVQEYPFPGLTGQNGLSIISDNMIDDYGTHQDYLYLWDGVEFNGLASQWFGNMVVPKNIENLWLSKSFAQYLEGLYTSEVNGIEEYLLWYHPWESGNFFNDWKNGHRHAIVSQKVSDAEIFSGDSYVKYRGALVLRMLRKELGDSLFFKSIQHFITTNAFKPVITKDFENSIYTVSGKDLHWFFDQWIYKTGHPVFKVNSQYDSIKQIFHLNLKQIQTMDSSIHDPQVKYFKGIMEIEIDDRIETIQIQAKEINQYSFTRKQKPIMVNLDIENTWIREIHFEKTIGEWIHILINSKDQSSRNNALNELVIKAKENGIDPLDKKNILYAIQNIIQSKCYWRFRLNAISQLRTIQSLPYDKQTTELFISLIKNEKSWVKAAAITSLGMTNDSLHSEFFIECLSDSSDRVVNAAAIALGKTKSSQAFETLVKLRNRPSWKNQSLMHCLSGLAQLGDVRAEGIALNALEDIYSPRWFLGNGWDYPIVAAQTLASLGMTEKAYQLIKKRLNIALQVQNIDDIFHQLILIVNLKNPKGLEIFEALKNKFNKDENILSAIKNYEDSFKASLNN